MRFFFKVKCYRTELISANLVYWYGLKNLPTNIQYKSELILIFLDFEHLSKTIEKIVSQNFNVFFFVKIMRKRLF